MSNIDRSSLANEIADRLWSLNERTELTRFISGELERKGIPVNQSWALSNFDRIRDLVKNELNRKIAYCQERGLTPKYRIGGSDDETLIPLVEKHVEAVESLLKVAIRSLQPIAFERFCSHFVSLVGVEKSMTMRGTKEEGIDFWGVLNIGIATGTATLMHVKIRLIGQAKLSYVGEVPIRTFSRDMKSFADKEGRAWDLSPKWFRNSKLPLLGVFISGKDLSHPARKWAMIHNIGVADLDQITQDLLRSSGTIPGLFKSDSTVSFDRVLFASYFAKKRH